MINVLLLGLLIRSKVAFTQIIMELSGILIAWHHTRMIIGFCICLVVFHQTDVLIGGSLIECERPVFDHQTAGVLNAKQSTIIRSVQTFP